MRDWPSAVCAQGRGLMLDIVLAGRSIAWLRSSETQRPIQGLKELIGLGDSALVYRYALTRGVQA